MTRPRKYTEDQIRDAVASSKSFREAYLKISTSINSSSGYQNFRMKVVDLNIDFSHFQSRGVVGNRATTLPWQDILVYDRRGTGTREESRRIRWAMLKSGIEWKCSDCGNPGEWNGQPMLLEIDHIDSNGLNNVKENLRFLCPNCHSLYPHSVDWRPLAKDENGLYTVRGTSSFFNKERAQPQYKMKIKPVEKSVCCECGGECGIKSQRCLPCANAKRQNKCKANWPPNDILEILVWEYPMTKLGEIFGVSDQAVRKRCIKNNIDLPGLGYWAKVYAGKIDK